MILVPSMLVMPVMTRAKRPIPVPSEAVPWKRTPPDLALCLSVGPHAGKRGTERGVRLVVGRSQGQAGDGAHYRDGRSGRTARRFRVSVRGALSPGALSDEEGPLWLLYRCFGGHGVVP